MFVNIWILLSILEIILLAGSTQVQNSFATLAFTRLLELTVLLEVSVAVVVLCCGISSQFVFVGSAATSKLSCCTIGVLALFVGLWFERVPFDVVEAESELIDGVTTELPGVVFSMTYAAEVVAFAVILKLFAVNPGISCLVLGIIILATFVGRIFLARFLFVHVINLLLLCALGLTQPAFWLLSSTRSELGDARTILKFYDTATGLIASYPGNYRSVH